MEFLKKFGIFALSLGLTLQNTAAFNGPTHRFVTGQASENICELGGEIGDFYNGYADLLGDFSVKPDDDENGSTTAPFKDHFYNYATELNYAGEKTSALTKLISHYKNAKQYYDIGKMQESMEELGRASHFLEDLSTPVHTFYESTLDATLKLNMHMDFEKKCDDIVSEDFDSPEVSKNYLEKFKFNTVRSIGIDASCLASDNLSAYYMNGHITDIQAGQNAISNAICSVTGLFFKFANECLKLKK